MKKLIVLSAVILTLSAEAYADNRNGRNACSSLPGYYQLTAALKASTNASGGPRNGGLENHMWATIVNPDGIVCSVTASGDSRAAQWRGSRVISAQKANTAGAFSLSNGLGGTEIALSTANLYRATQPGGSLFGLQFSNPVNTDAAYEKSPERWGKANDPMVGEFIGGVNVFGGGLALYNEQGQLLGALGVSGDTSCADHNVAWRVRQALGLNHVPGGVSANGDDGIIYEQSNPFSHAECAGSEKAIAIDIGAGS